MQWSPATSVGQPFPWWVTVLCEGWAVTCSRSTMRDSLACSVKASVRLPSAHCCPTKLSVLSKTGGISFRNNIVGHRIKNILSQIRLATYFPASPMFLWLVTLLWKPREKTGLCLTLPMARKLWVMFHMIGLFREVKSAKVIAGFKTGLNEIQVKHRRVLLLFSYLR